MSLYQVGDQLVLETGSSVYQSGDILVNETFVSPALEEQVDQNLLFTDSATSSLQTQEVSDTCNFTDAASSSNVIEDSAEQNLLFTDSASPSLISFDVESDLLFTDEALSTQPEPIERSEEQSALFSDSAASSLLTPEVTDTVLFTQVASGLNVVPGTELDFEQTLLFTDSAQKIKILAGATDHDAEDTLNFTQRASIPYFADLQQFLFFTDVSDSERIIPVEDELTFSHDVDTNVNFVKTVTQNCLFTHAFAFELNDNIDCDYSVTVGGTTDPNAPAAPSTTSPTITKQGYVELFYPLVSPTTTVRIRSPELGDRDRLQFDKIHRETRGGSLRIFADTTWPKVQILEMLFHGLKESEAQDVMDFFEDTLGLTVGFRDWEGRIWHGVVVTPDSPLIRTKRNIVDLSFEFEGELQ